jgi:hypothetical protein
VKEILELHLLGHLITYNYYLTDNVQKAQAAWHRRQLEENLKSFFGNLKQTEGAAYHHFNIKALLDAIASHTELDIDKFLCSMATNIIEAYYKVSRPLNTKQHN